MLKFATRIGLPKPATRWVSQKSLFAAAKRDRELARIMETGWKHWNADMLPGEVSKTDFTGQGN